ncbi:MAG: DUF3263 domain-containing protein [Actinomycetales bacterium]
MEERALQSSDLDLRLLDFEREWWRHAGSKEAGVKEKFGISLSEYYERLNNLIDSDEALAIQPLLVKRLRRLRALRISR